MEVVTKVFSVAKPHFGVTHLITVETNAYEQLVRVLLGRSRVLSVSSASGLNPLVSSSVVRRAPSETRVRRPVYDGRVTRGTPEGRVK